MSMLRLLWVSALLAPLVGRAETLTLECEFSAPELQAFANGTRVTVVDCAPLQRVGAPLLPFRTLRVLLPPGGKVVQVQARSLDEPAQLSLSAPVEYGRLPAGSPDSNQLRLKVASADGPDPAIYQSEGPYPRTAVELASVQRFAGYEVALLRVYPVQYWPVKAELSWTRRLSVEIMVDSLVAQGQGAVSVSKIRPQAGARERVRTWVDNPGMLQAYEEVVTPKDGPGEAYDYLLITRSNLVAAFQPLVEQKTQDGLRVKVQTVESITNSVAGRDVQEKIRSFIRQTYQSSGVSYVLLGGDVATIPCRYAYVSMGGLVANPTLPTDLYYACLDGTWNADGDSNWGEPNDGEGGGDVDLLAEVYVGRAPVDTPAEVGVFVGKTVRYATQPHVNPTNALFLAEFLEATPSGPAQGGDMFNPLVPLFTDYRVSWLDDRSTVPEWVKQDALNAMNQSPHLVLFNGHGNDHTLIGVQKPFVRSIETPDIALLTNPWPFLAYSVGCNVGQFDNDRFSPDAIGEELVKQHDRGAFAAILNSRLGWYDDQDEAKYSGEFQARFFAQVLSNGQTNFGVANQLGKHDLVSRLENSGIMTYRWCYYEITLFGDPHLAWQKPVAVPPTRQFLVTSLHGGASPPTGAHIYAQGTALTCQVTNSPVAGTTGTRYLCTGWTGTGSVPAAGSGSQVMVTLTQDSQLTWLWQTQMWLVASAGAHGTVTANNGWQDSGTAVTVSAVPSPYYHFDRWTGDVPAGAISNATLQLTMDRPRTLTAAFAENVTSQGTPHWWLASYGWTNQFETAAGADTDNDGAAAWEEYVAGTSPADGTAVLRLASVSVVGSDLQFAWPSVAGRHYSIWTATDLRPGGFVLLTNNLVATPPTNTFSVDGSPTARTFFRIGVEHQ